MTKRSEQATAIRKVIGHIPGAWVRVFGDDKIWASGTGEFSKTSTERGMCAVRAALEAAGYRCEANGRPGTSGEWILDVFPPARDLSAAAA